MHSGRMSTPSLVALNRDIEGYSNIYPMWQQTNHDRNDNLALLDIKYSELQMQNSSEVNVNQNSQGIESGQQMANAPNTQSGIFLQHNQAPANSQEIKMEQQQHPFQLSQSSPMPMSVMGSGQVHELGKIQNLSNKAQFPNIQQFSNRPSPASEQGSNPAKCDTQIPFGAMLPFILPELEKDKGVLLQTLYDRLRKDEIAKKDFIPLVRGIVGEHLLEMALMKMKTKMAREPQPRPSQTQLQPQNQLQRQYPLRPPAGDPNVGGATKPMGVMVASNFERHNSFNNFKRMPSGSKLLVPGGSGGQQAPQRKPSNEERKIGPTSSMPYVKQEAVQMYKPPYSSLQGPSSFRVETEQGSSGTANSNDAVAKKHPPQVASACTGTASSSAKLQGVQSGCRAPSPNTTVATGNNTRAPAKKASCGQKKPFDSVGSSAPLPGKKQKVAGGCQDQSIEQLNDVVAVSGTNIREEEEQLFSKPKDEIRASGEVVQEEEEMLLLQKLPLEQKLAQIMSRCGIKNLSNDVERCLSLCVEERLRGLVRGMIRISRQRADTEKFWHHSVVTSDARQQILDINQKAKEQAETDKFRRLNEPNSSTGTEADKEKEENQLKANKEEDDKMAANVVARIAVGGDDMLSKWKLMAEQGHQKRKRGGGADDAASCERPTSIPLRSQGGDKRESLGSAKSGALQGRNKPIIHPRRPARNNISLEDMISVLERERSAQSAMLYRLYQKL